MQVTPSSSSSSSSVRNSAVTTVLTNAPLLRLIAAFVPGLPFHVGEFARRERWRRSPDGRYPVCRGWLFQLAILAGDVDQLNSLLALSRLPEHAQRPELLLFRVVRCAVQCASLEVLQWLSDAVDLTAYPFESDLLDLACVHCPGVTTLQWLDTNVPHMRSRVEERAMLRAAEAGRIEVLRWLHDHYYEGFTPATMEYAARGGQLEIVRFLHEFRREGCTSRAMDAAAANGHLAVVAFLHKHRTEGCSEHAMTEAAVRGHVDVVAFLGAHRHESVAAGTLIRVVLEHNAEMVRLLCLHTTDGCLHDARRCAATRNDSATIAVLDEFIDRRVKSCTITRHGQDGPRPCQQQDATDNESEPQVSLSRWSFRRWTSRKS